MKLAIPAHYVDRWLWLCPLLAIVLVAGIFWAFGLTWWTAALAAVLLVCPVLIVWGLFKVTRD